jgi:hypothetical protein
MSTTHNSVSAATGRLGRCWVGRGDRPPLLVPKCSGPQLPAGFRMAFDAHGVADGCPGQAAPRGGNARTSANFSGVMLMRPKCRLSCASWASLHNLSPRSRGSLAVSLSYVRDGQAQVARRTSPKGPSKQVREFSPTHCVRGACERERERWAFRRDLEWSW